MGEQQELIERLDRLEAAVKSLERHFSEHTESEQTGEGNPLQDMLSFVYKQKKECRDQDYRSYLERMETRLLAEQKKLDEMRLNLEKNHEVYLKNLTQKAEEPHWSMAPADRPVLNVAKADFDVQAEEDGYIGARHDDMDMLADANEVTGIGSIQDEAAHGIAVQNEMPYRAGDTYRPADGTESSKPDRKKHSVEFNIGGVVLSVIGAVFIILSLINFGRSFMDSFAQGVALYVLGLVVIIFSELVLRKHLENFSMVISGTGLGILYTATILNYLYLKTMRAPLAIEITLVISVATLLYARHKDSGFLRVIGILGCYASFLPLDTFETATTVMILCGILLIVNGLYLMLPNKTYNRAVSVAHVVANVLVSIYFSVVLVLSAKDVRTDALLPITLFLTGMLVINCVIKAGGQQKAMDIFCVICEAVIGALLLMQLAGGQNKIPALGIAAAGLLVCFFVERKDPKLRWVHLYVFSILLLGGMIGSKGGGFMIAVAVLLAIYKLLGGFEQLKVSGMIVSVLAAIVFLLGVKDTSNMQYLILAVAVTAVFFTKYFKTTHQILLMAMLEGYSLLSFESEVGIVLALFLLLLLMIMLSVFEYLRDDHFKGVSVCAAVTSALLILGAASFEKYRYIFMSLTLVIGLVIIFLLFGRVFALCGKNAQHIRNLTLAFFTTYMVVIFRVEKPIVTSILLMVLALICVGTGFAMSQKPIRLYGLVLAMFVCAKLLFMDFTGAAAADKVILTFVVGVLAIGISYLYMRLEKKDILQQKSN